MFDANINRRFGTPRHIILAWEGVGSLLQRNVGFAAERWAGAATTRHAVANMDNERVGRVPWRLDMVRGR
jgi:hypothetical protein